MFETGTQTAEYAQSEYGRRARRRRRRWEEDQASSGQAPSGQTAGEYGQYAEAEYGYGEGEYDEAEYDTAEYGTGEYDAGEYGGGEGESEEQFLPLIPIVGKVLAGLLGGLVKEAESAGEYGQGEYGHAENEDEAGEAEEVLLHRVITRVLGQEPEYDQEVLTPAQEAEFTDRLLEVSNEQELGQILGGIVNTVGGVVQGIRGAVQSPQGRAVVNAVKPVARAALPQLGRAVGRAIGRRVGTSIARGIGMAARSLFETETSELTAEQEQYEVASRIVRLTASAARDVAAAPAGAPCRVGRRVRPRPRRPAPRPAAISRCSESGRPPAATGATPRRQPGRSPRPAAIPPAPAGQLVFARRRVRAPEPPTPAYRPFWMRRRCLAARHLAGP
jgi:hypothetical protein